MFPIHKVILPKIFSMLRDNLFNDADYILSSVKVIKAEGRYQGSPLLNGTGISKSGFNSLKTSKYYFPKNQAFSYIELLEKVTYNLEIIKF